MKKAILVAAALGALSIGYARDSRAGYKYAHPVTINNTYRYAAGSLSSAHNTADTVQYLGCRSEKYADGSGWGYCWAYDAAGQHAICFTTNGGFLDRMASLSDDTHLTFYWGAGSSDCTKIVVQNSSQYAAKQ